MSSPLTRTTPIRRRRQPLSSRAASRPVTKGGFLRACSSLRPHPRSCAYFVVLSIILWAVRGFTLPTGTPIWGDHPARAAKSSKHTPEPARRPWRADDDITDSNDPAYRPFVPLEAPAQPFPRLMPTRFLSPDCLERWFSEGTLDCDAAQLGLEEKLDVTWLWVNGSDPRWRISLEHYRGEEGIYSPEHHFRDNNELLYSVRSVVQALPRGLDTVHLVIADFEIEGRDSRLLPADVSVPEARQSWRVAQIPTWLNLSRIRALHDAEHLPYFRYATHSEIFHLPPSFEAEDSASHALREERWRENALPTFNSMSIESRLGWLPGLRDVTLACNDDFFLLMPHAVSDFHSPLYGSVIRFDPGYYQQVKPILDKTRFNDAGEVSGLYHANYILSKRFPRRLRPYHAHAPKVITRSLLHEASLMFREDLTMSSQRRFREVPHGEGDIQMQWLLGSLRVERWREALLWTFIVARMGEAETTAPGTWDIKARAGLRELFDLTTDDEDVAKIQVEKGVRETLEPLRLQRNFEQAGWEPPRATKMLFSSMDGHLPPIPRPGMSPQNADRCILDLDRCFGRFWTLKEAVNADVMFKRLAFQNPECGDCLINALVTASGPLGLSAFLPLKGQIHHRPRQPRPADGRLTSPPLLPLTSSWQEANFSLPAVLADSGTVELRDFAMKLLSRYQYMCGSSNYQFHMLSNPDQTKDVLAAVDADPAVSILGLNDDINDGYEQARELLNEWFERRWPAKLVWERGWDPSVDP